MYLSCSSAVHPDLCTSPVHLLACEPGQIAPILPAMVGGLAQVMDGVLHKLNALGELFQQKKNSNEL